MRPFHHPAGVLVSEQISDIPNVCLFKTILSGRLAVSIFMDVIPAPSKDDQQLFIFVPEARLLYYDNMAYHFMFFLCEGDDEISKCLKKQGESVFDEILSNRCYNET